MMMLNSNVSQYQYLTYAKIPYEKIIRKKFMCLQKLTAEREIRTPISIIARDKQCLSEFQQYIAHQIITKRVHAAQN